MARTAHQLVNQSSGNVELYTPKDIIEASHACFGTIDLDPASSMVANEVVQASRIFTVDDDGLQQSWFGNVWMNHPYGRFEKACGKGCKKKICKKRKYHRLTDFAGNAAWINKLVYEYEHGDVYQALSIAFNSSSEGWFRPLLKYPQCILDGRMKFRNPDGSIDGNATKGCVITYMGNDLDRFARCFAHLGEIKISYQPKSE